MTGTSKNLVIAGVVIVALLFSLSPYLGKGRYQMMGVESGTWKIDTITGQVWGCTTIVSRNRCLQFNNVPPTTE